MIDVLYVACCPSCRDRIINKMTAEHSCCTTLYDQRRIILKNGSTFRAISSDSLDQARGLYFDKILYCYQMDNTMREHCKTYLNPYAVRATISCSSDSEKSVDTLITVK